VAEHVTSHRQCAAAASAVHASMSLRKSSMRTISGCDAYARAEDHLVERTNVGAISTCNFARPAPIFMVCMASHTPVCHASTKTTCRVAVTLVGAVTVLLLLANEVSVLMQPQRTEQVA
jgi:hypothetical protein